MDLKWYKFKYLYTNKNEGFCVIIFQSMLIHFSYTDYPLQAVK